MGSEGAVPPHELKPPLQSPLPLSNTRGDDGTATAGTSGTTGQQRPSPAERLCLRVSAVSRTHRGKRLVILRTWARVEGKLQRVELRALIDSGAETSLITRAAVDKLGARIEHGKFGVGLGVFGKQSPLTMCTQLQLSFLGTEPTSGLAKEYHTQEAEKLLVVSQLAGQEYDMLLGFPFMQKHRATLQCAHPVVMRLTAESGETVEVTPIGRGDDTAEREAEEAERLRIAAVARTEAPDTVMTTDELEQLWLSAEPGTVKVFPIIMHHRRDNGGVRVNNVAFKSAKETSAAGLSPAKPPEENEPQVGQKATDKQEGGQLPAGVERDKAAAIQARLTAEFKDVFPDDLPKFDANANPRAGVKIRTKPDAQPFGRYGPRMTAEDAQTASTMIRELLEKGFIQPSQSPWGAPMFLVAKPDGSRRMVIDYRGLNAATIRNRYPLPRVDELFDQLRGARFFTKLDLRSGYWQIGMDPDAVEKTAFTSREGHFEWLVLPMGLTNAPAEFMHMMQDTFREQLNKSVLVFLDDILIFSRTLEEHEQHLRWVLQQLREKKLYGKLSKCEYFRQAKLGLLGLLGLLGNRFFLKQARERLCRLRYQYLNNSD